MFFIFRARQMVDVSRKYMALMLKVYKQNLLPLLKFLEHAYQGVWTLGQGEQSSLLEVTAMFMTIYS